MTERPKAYQDLARQMYRECDNNQDLYPSSRGIDVPGLDGPPYNVTYLPPIPRYGIYNPTVIVTNGTLQAPTREYRVYPRMLVTNHEPITTNHGIVYSADGDEFSIDNVETALRLLARVRTAHSIAKLGLNTRFD